MHCFKWTFFYSLIEMENTGKLLGERCPAGAQNKADKFKIYRDSFVNFRYRYCTISSRCKNKSITKTRYVNSEFTVFRYSMVSIL